MENILTTSCDGILSIPADNTNGCNKNSYAIKIGTFDVTVKRCDTLVVGAGAAAMNCAVHLAEFALRAGKENPADGIKIITGGVLLGTSRMSGSDKQTYYKLGTAAETADSALSMAESLTAAGCCHEDLAIIESISSLREFFHLVRSGVPFPHDNMGAFVGYKTDHDPFERATSAGPKTSKFMSVCLEREANELGIEMIDNQEAVHLFSKAGRLTGILTIDKKLAALGDMEKAFTVWQAGNYVLATGGPGELYKTSVYPASQPSIHGLCLMAGMKADNITESQFGLASTKFRWNVSGTYMQAVPRIYSIDNEGVVRDFLNGAFETTALMATDIFLKGYQWPFDPQRIDRKQSSLIDMLVYRENQLGRKVYMDFRENPKAIDDEFRVEALHEEARDYLVLAGATQQLPIERLAHMNTPAIDIYTEHDIDLYNEPLEISVCHQHCNGGMAVDFWWRAYGMDNVFVIGELAGTHGVKRPGGSALNAGQAGGLRAADYIVNACSCDATEIIIDEAQTKAVMDIFADKSGGLNPAEALDELKAVMTKCAGHVRSKELASEAAAKITALLENMSKSGFTYAKPVDIITAVRLRHLAVTALAVVESIAALLAAGAGSRGSHLVLDDAGEILDELLLGQAGEPIKAIPENLDLRDRIAQVSFDSTVARAKVEMVPVRKVSLKKDAFEVAWAKYNDKKIYGK